MTLLRLSTLWLLGLFLLPLTAHAQEVRTEGCLTDVYAHLAHEERLYKSVLFGQKASEDLDTGSVRYDQEFNTWMKTADNTWRSLASGFSGTTWSDMLMDQQADIPARRGLIEVRKVPTSDLIPALTHSMRALQCRLQSVCAAATASPAAIAASQTTLSVQAKGCIGVTLPVFTRCSGESIVEIDPKVCEQSVDAIIERESRLLSLLTSYDAAYRSLLQFMGGFEGFLTDFRFPLIDPLWQAVRALGSIDRLPCFLSQCDE